MIKKFQEDSAAAEKVNINILENQLFEKIVRLLKQAKDALEIIYFI